MCYVLCVGTSNSIQGCAHGPNPGVQVTVLFFDRRVCVQGGQDLRCHKHRRTGQGLRGIRDAEESRGKLYEEVMRKLRVLHLLASLLDHC